MEIQKSVAFWSGLKAIIERVSKQYDTQWQKRKRVLSTKFLVLFIFKLVLSKNRQGYNSVLCELWGSGTEDKLLELPQRNPIAASSMCEARQKMPETIFQKLNEEILLYWKQTKPAATWRGHRIFATDGSRLNLPHELSREGYKIQDKERRHYPTGLLSTLYNLSEGIVYDFVLQAHIEERLCAIEHMNKMTKGDVLILDRGYFSYLLLHQSIEKDVDIVCRMQPGTVNGEIKEFWDSKSTDTIIEYYPSPTVISDLKKRGFILERKKIPLRLIKYTINNEVYVCATTLLSRNYQVVEFAELYHGRWGIEELYKISKQFLEVEDFHSQTERGVKQELYAHLLLINIARIFEYEAKNNLPPPTIKKEAVELGEGYWQGFYEDLQKIKINFKNCLLVVGRYLNRLFLASKNAISLWLPKAIILITRVRQKIRPGRHYPRHSFKPAKKWVRFANA